MELNVKAYIKRVGGDFEPIVLTSTAHMKELIGTTGKQSAQVHTSKGFSIYANPDAEGNCTGHTVDLSGSVRFWSGDYLVTRFKGKSLIDMDDYDLAIFESSVLNKMKMDDEPKERKFDYVADADALRAAIKERVGNE